MCSVHDTDISTLDADLRPRRTASSDVGADTSSRAHAMFTKLHSFTQPFQYVSVAGQHPEGELACKIVISAAKLCSVHMQYTYELDRHMNVLACMLLLLTCQSVLYICLST